MVDFTIVFLISPDDFSYSHSYLPGHSADVFLSYKINYKLKTVDNNNNNSNNNNMHSAFHPGARHLESSRSSPHGQTSTALLGGAECHHGGHHSRQCGLGYTVFEIES